MDSPTGGTPPELAALSFRIWAWRRRVVKSDFQEDVKKRIINKRHAAAISGLYCDKLKQAGGFMTLTDVYWRTKSSPGVGI
jgi:hypothetical protein